MADTAKIAAALAAFQAEAPTVKKSQRAEVPTKAGGKYTYTFANLANVTEAAYPLLAKHGLSFSACPERHERGYGLVGWLLHSSGESLRGELPIQGNTAQEIGSSITYGRRYLLGCMTGIVTDDDDDGALASRAKKPAAKPAPKAEAPMLDTSSGLAKRMFKLFGDAEITDKELRLAYVSDVVGRVVASSKDMTDDDARKVSAALEAELEVRRQADAPDSYDEPPGWGTTP